MIAVQLRGGDADDTADAPLAATSATSPDATGVAAVATVPPAEAGTTPDFVGVSLEAARERLTELGFTPAVIEVASTEAPAGRVFAQSPEAGEPLREGLVVTLVVSAGSP